MNIDDQVTIDLPNDPAIPASTIVFASLAVPHGVRRCSITVVVDDKATIRLHVEADAVVESRREENQWI